MGSFKPHTFDPLELEILDLVYQAARAQLIARDPNRNVSKDGRRQSALRKRISLVQALGRSISTTSAISIMHATILDPRARPPSRRKNPYS